MNEPSLPQDLMTLADRFRTGDALSASVELPDLLVRLASRASPDELARLVPIFSALLAALERKDWLGLADSLEVELLLATGARVSERLERT